jgi:hypothetical protein
VTVKKNKSGSQELRSVSEWIFSFLFFPFFFFFFFSWLPISDVRFKIITTFCYEVYCPSALGFTSREGRKLDFMEVKYPLTGT